MIFSLMLQVSHGDRFQRLWRRYKHDMSGNTWAGNAEMAAIKALYPVNIVVWQISSTGISHQGYRIYVGQATTLHLHLHLVNEVRYETTDIPSSYVHLPSIDVAPPVVSAVRVSGREMRPQQSNA